MSDLGPECVAKRTSADQSEFMVHALMEPWLRQNNPTGKFSLSPSGKSLLGLPPSCPRGRGVGHRHERWGGMRWTRQRRARDGMAGRASRSVSVTGRAGRTMLKRTAKACGPDASVVGVKSAEGKSARPGADEPAIRIRRRQQSPILRGERVISRKAIAQGMSDRLRCPVCSCAFLYPFCTRDRGCSAHPAFPAPSCLRDNDRQASGKSCRENADAYLVFEI